MEETPMTAPGRDGWLIDADAHDVIYEAERAYWRALLDRALQCARQAGRKCKTGETLITLADVQQALKAIAPQPLDPHSDIASILADQYEPEVPRDLGQRIAQEAIEAYQARLQPLGAAIEAAAKAIAAIHNGEIEDGEPQFWTAGWVAAALRNHFAPAPSQKRVTEATSVIAPNELTHASPAPCPSPSPKPSAEAGGKLPMVQGQALVLCDDTFGGLAVVQRDAMNMRLAEDGNFYDTTKYLRARVVFPYLRTVSIAENFACQHADQPQPASEAAPTEQVAGAVRLSLKPRSKIGGCVRNDGGRGPHKFELGICRYCKLPAPDF